jgi:hypothetical protein
MNIKELFTKRRSFPPILLGVVLLVLASYHFFLAFGPNLQQVVDVDKVVQEGTIAIAEGESSQRRRA